MLHVFRDGEWIAGPIERPLDFPGRAKGLLGRDSLPGRSGMLIEGCNSIHTFFMKFPIDVVFLAGGGRVLKVCPAVKPFRAAFSLFASRTVELAAGAAAAAGIERGQVLEIKEGTGMAER